MKRSKIRSGVLGFATLSGAFLVMAGPSVGVDPAVGAPRTFAYTGAAQTWTVPDGVCSVTVDALGAQGGPGDAFLATGMTSNGPHGYIPIPRAGGLGARATSTIDVTPGEQLVVRVGGAGDGGMESNGQIVTDATDAENLPRTGAGGWNGGADGGSVASDGVHAGGGGGASDVRLGGSTPADRVVVAGGGGGSGAGSAVGAESVGTGAGGNSASAGSNGGLFAASVSSTPGGNIISGVGAGGGAPGTGTAGGAGGSGAVAHGGTPIGAAGENGGVAKGGTGGGSHLSASEVSTAAFGGVVGGGGGGGLFGGGGGGAAILDADSSDIPPGYLMFVVAGGGGGGSSLGDTVQQGVHEGNGQVTITPISGDCHAPTTPSAPKSVSAQAQPATAVAARPTFTG